MILLIDNYDSFVYNLARYFAELSCETQVARNDQLQLDDIRAASPQAIVLSPGPCTPSEAGICVDVVREFGATVPILGVCLGHQAIAAAWGADIIRAPVPVHGRSSLIHHTGTGLFEGLPNPFKAARYHSLIFDERSLSPELEVTGRTADGIPMAISHKSRPVFGVQFHPESILTECGHRLLANFLRFSGIRTAAELNGDLAPVADNRPDWYAAEALPIFPHPIQIRM